MRRRTRWSGILAIGLAGLLVAAPVPAAGSPDGASGAQRSRTGATVEGKQPRVVPLSADLEVSRFAADADGVRQRSRETTRFYRDSQGRTREETGSVVTISDPTSGTTVRLDTASRTVQRSAGTPLADGAAERRGTATEHQQISSPRRSLGTALINGVRAEGQAFTVSRPAAAGAPARQWSVETWLATEVQLTARTRVTDPTGYEYTQTYTNIRAGVEPAAELFQVPAGYRDAAAAPPRSGTAATCPVNNEPDPLILNSFDWVYLDRGYINATTDPEAGCLFLASGWYLEYPIGAYATVPLGLPFDRWFVYDTGGGGLPYLPWPALGDIVFGASNGSDLTVKDSLIVLTVWPAI